MLRFLLSLDKERITSSIPFTNRTDSQDPSDGKKSSHWSYEECSTPNNNVKTPVIKVRYFSALLSFILLSSFHIASETVLYYTSINFRQYIISLEDKCMKRIKVLGSVLKRTRADKIIIGFIVFIFAIAAVIQLVEPDINRYGDALWYCYAVISTAGFGDVVAVTFIGKMCSVLLTIYSLFVVAIATGVVVNFYTQMVELQRKETLAMFMDQLERLPELSREELENISRKVRQFR